MDIQFWQAIVDADCAPPAGHTPAELMPELLAGLGSPDPVLRDELTYTILAIWIERGVYAPAELRAIAHETAANLSAGLGERETDSVFLRSFSALILGEVVDADSANPFLDAGEVQAWLERAVAYAGAERDLRGYVAGKGWAHAAAHMADLLMAFARSPHGAADDLERIVEAIGARANAPSAYAFRHMEDERLASAALAAIERDLLAPPFLDAWLDGVAAMWSGQTWPTASKVEEQTNAYHNTRQFLRSLYFQLTLAARAPGLREALQARILAGLRVMDRYFYGST